MKRIAVCLYGHCRTFELTFESFFKFIVEPNKLDGYKIDIFFHTWDVYHDSHGSWHKYNFILDKVILNENDKKRLIDIYNPKAHLFEILENGEHGIDISLEKVNFLRESYEKLQKVSYQQIIYTRMDVMFLYPFRVNVYINAYNEINKKFIGNSQTKVLFTCNNAFTRYPIADNRFPNESDLLWFCNFSSKRPHYDNKCVNILTDYRLHNHFYIARTNILTEENIWKRIEQYEQLLMDKNKLSFQTKYGTAKTRIQNQLSYKLGQAMIVNSKSILGYIRMPFVLSYIKDKHKQEQKIYQEKIKKDPSLKLPPLEDYPDYQEALKLKNHLSYKLGQALIQANKTWYGGGYIKLLLKIRKLKLYR
ncbi:galactosyltransferase [Campylobacter lari]|nr:galactosyltransferase [Campylobacter lari]